MRNPKLFFELSPGAIVQAQAHHLDPVKFNTDITLRDLAAIAAMQGMTANPNTSKESFSNGSLEHMSVLIADALLAELEKQP